MNWLHFGRVRPNPGLMSWAWTRSLALGLALTPLACTNAFVFSPAAALATIAPLDLPIEPAKVAFFGDTIPSNDARDIADRVLQSNDHAGGDFFIIDKKQAKLYVFNAAGLLRGSTAVLLGSAEGDDSVPDIGARPLDQVRPHERTTPAGRFVAERGRNLQGEDIVWVDYEAAVSMHRVRASNVKERRMERLETPSVLDNRISFGCINIPKVFYESVVAPTVAQQGAVIYILPDVKPLHEVFNFYPQPKGT